MKETKDVVCMVIDSGGGYVSVAERLSREFKTVFYCCPSWIDSYPKLNKPMIGFGIAGIEVVESPWEVFSEIDLWVFPDCYFGFFQNWLVEQGEIVWGSRNGEEMELQRDVLKEHMKTLGLPVQKYETITGITALRAYLEKNEDVFVKINKWRGTIETFYSKNYQLIKPELDEIAHCLGAFGDLIEFVIEQPVRDAVEVGFDGWTVDGAYPAVCLSGVEVKDKAYAGIVKRYDEISPLITGFNAKMADTFKKYGYRGFFSTEIRVDKKKTPYMIDFTARTPCPPGEIYLELYENYGEIIWRGANGEMLPPVTSGVCAVELLIESEWSCHNFQPVYFPKKFAPQIKLKKNMIVDGTNFIIPQAYGADDCGAVIGMGNTLAAAIASCRAAADSIEGNGVSIRQDTLDEAQAELDKFEAMK